MGRSALFWLFARTLCGDDLRPATSHALAWIAVSKHRVLPFKMQLADAQGLPVTSLGSVPPVVKVTYTSPVGATADVSASAVPAGMGTVGRQFVFAEGKWQFNLQTKAYTAPGTYTVNVVSGGGYTIEPGCTGSFIVK